MQVDLRDGHGSYSMTKYVAHINNKSVLGLYYLKARGEVIDIGKGVLVVEGPLVPRKYRFTEGMWLINRKVRIINYYVLFTKIQ